MLLFLRQRFPTVPRLGVYLDLACKQSYFPPGNGINRRNKSKKNTIIVVNTQVLLIVLSTDYITQSSCFPNFFNRNC